MVYLVNIAIIFGNPKCWRTARTNRDQAPGYKPTHTEDEYKCVHSLSIPPLHSIGGTRRAFKGSSWFPFPLLENVVISTQTPPIGLVLHKNSKIISIGVILKNDHITLDLPPRKSWKEPNGITRLITKGATLQKQTKNMNRTKPIIFQNQLVRLIFGSSSKVKITYQTQTILLAINILLTIKRLLIINIMMLLGKASLYVPTRGALRSFLSIYTKTRSSCTKQVALRAHF